MLMKDRSQSIETASTAKHTGFKLGTHAFHNHADTANATAIIQDMKYSIPLWILFLILFFIFPSLS
jgi:hypothetical protein